MLFRAGLQEMNAQRPMSPGGGNASLLPVASAQRCDQAIGTGQYLIP